MVIHFQFVFKITRTTIVVSNGRYTFYQIPFIQYHLSNTIHQIPFIKYLLSNIIYQIPFFLNIFYQIPIIKYRLSNRAFLKNSHRV